MNVIVCIKQVPEVSDADVEINATGTAIEMDDLVMEINEWDNYAVEEAVRIKEAYGGKVTVITLGDEDSEDVLRRALAMGADEAIRIDGEDFVGSDAAGIARGLYGAIRPLPFDLLLTGAQSADDGWAEVGIRLAEMFRLPYASLAVGLQIDDGQVKVIRELESNTEESVQMPFPAAVTIQTGINEPRYVSIMGIRKVRGIEIRVMGMDDLGLARDEIGREGSSIDTWRLSVPEQGGGAEILEGSLGEICMKTAQILRDRGGIT